MDGSRLATLAQDSSSRTGSLDASSRLASDHAQVLVRTAPGKVVSLGTCTKVCAISFTIGVFVGFTLKRRLKKWVTKILKRMRDD